MGIFDRIGRLARSEVSELKRVLRDGESARDDGDLAGGMNEFERDERERRRLIAEAEAELARADGDSLSAEIEAGAAIWGGTAGATPDPTAIELARGAELWGQGAEPARVNPKAGRVHSFTREVREAYAALELPLGSDREAIEAAYRALILRYHPDRHAQAPHLQQAATELTIRIRAARDLLLGWLAGA